MSEVPFSANFKIGRGPNGELATAWEISRPPNPLELMIWQSAMVTKVDAISEAFRKTETTIQAPPAPTSNGVAHPPAPRLFVPEGVAQGESA